MNIQILANALKFLERVAVTGNEAYAWCEAHQYIQTEMSKLAQSQISEQTSKLSLEG
jgi:hypothetical protein